MRTTCAPMRPRAGSRRMQRTRARIHYVCIRCPPGVQPDRTAFARRDRGARTSERCSMRLVRGLRLLGSLLLRLAQRSLQLAHMLFRQRFAHLAQSSPRFTRPERTTIEIDANQAHARRIRPAARTVEPSGALLWSGHQHVEPQSQRTHAASSMRTERSEHRQHSGPAPRMRRNQRTAARSSGVPRRTWTRSRLG